MTAQYAFFILLFLSLDFWTIWYEICQLSYAIASEASPQKLALTGELILLRRLLLNGVQPNQKPCHLQTIVYSNWGVYWMKFKKKRCLFFYCMWTCVHRQTSFQRSSFQKEIWGMITRELNLTLKIYVKLQISIL